MVGGEVGLFSCYLHNKKGEFESCAQVWSYFDDAWLFLLVYI